METNTPNSRVVYESMKELVAEWQAAQDERAMWEYLDMPEYVFKDWMKKCQQGKIDA